jgi:hypothetical protein
LRQALEKSSGDRSGRRLRRASQWTIEDYRAEYDRHNLELSKLRQQVAQLQDRDANQVSLIKGELQKLAEAIIVLSQPKPATSLGNGIERSEPVVRRAAEPGLRRDRPVPWPQTPLSSADRKPGEPAPVHATGANLEKSAPLIGSEVKTQSTANRLDIAVGKAAPSPTARTSLLQDIQPKPSGMVPSAEEQAKMGEKAPTLPVRQEPSSALVDRLDKSTAREEPEEQNIAARFSPALSANKSIQDPAQEAKIENGAEHDLGEALDLVLPPGEPSKQGNASKTVQESPAINGSAPLPQGQTLLDRLRGVSEGTADG